MKKQLLYLTILGLSSFAIAPTFAADAPQLNLEQRKEVDALIEKLYIETFLKTSKPYRRSFRSILEDIQPEKKTSRSENNYNGRTKDLKYILKRLQSDNRNDMLDLENYFTKNIGASSRFGSDFQYPDYKASTLKNGFYVFVATEMPDFFKGVPIATSHREMQLSRKLSKESTQKWRTAAQLTAAAGAASITLTKLRNTLKAFKVIQQINALYSGNIVNFIQLMQQAMPDSWSREHMPYIKIQTIKMANLITSWQNALYDAAQSSPQSAVLISKEIERLFAASSSANALPGLPYIARAAASDISHEYAIPNSFRNRLDNIMEKIAVSPGAERSSSSPFGQLMASASASLKGLYDQFGTLAKQATTTTEANNAKAIQFAIDDAQNALRTTTEDTLQGGTSSEITQDAAALEQAGTAISMAAVQAAMESHGWAGTLTPFLEQLATTIGEVAAEAATIATEGGFEWVPLGEVAF